MAQIGTYRNVFDDKNEFDKLHDLFIDAVQEFSDYREGMLTLGEVMYVMECILDEMRGTSEKDANTHKSISGLKSPTFSTLMAIQARLVETALKRGIITQADESYVLHGER